MLKRKPGRASLDPIQFIRTNLPLVPVAAIPEIRLHRAQASSGLWRLAQSDKDGFGTPYWAYPWAGGLALARYILERPEIVAGRRVFDLGAGSGLVAIAAAKAGASEVFAADIDPYAIAAMGLNAAANDVSLSIVCGDAIAEAAPAVDLVLVGDLFYDPDLAAGVTAFLDRCRDAGVEILVGDPGRAFLPLSRLRRLADYQVTDFGDTEAAAKSSAVFSFR